MNVEQHDALLILLYRYIIGRYPAYPSHHYLLLRTYILPRYTYYLVFLEFCPDIFREKCHFTPSKRAVAVGLLHPVQTPSHQSDNHHAANGPVDVPPRSVARVLFAVADGQRGWESRL